MKTLREMMDLIEAAQSRFDEPLSGWHIVYRKSGNPVHGTPSFATQDQAQKYLMTRMFANHHEYKVVHTAGVGVTEGLNEFTTGGRGNSGDYLRALASAWYNGTFNTGSLQRGIKSQEDVERVLARGIVCADGKTRRYNIDYNPSFDGVVIFSDDYYEHGDAGGDVDSRTGRPWGPHDYIEFKDAELDEGVEEEQIDETSPEALSKIDELYKS